MLPPTLDRESLAGKSILLVDDVADSGRTLQLVVELLRAGGGRGAHGLPVQQADHGRGARLRLAQDLALDHVPVELRGPGAVPGWAARGMTVRPLAELIDPGLGRRPRAGRARRSPRWATSCAPRSRRGGRTCRPGDERAARVRGAARRRAGADRRAGPVPDARASGRPVVLGRARACARCRAACRTSTGSCATTSASRRPPHGDLTPWARAGRHAAQPGAHRAGRASRARIAARAGRR